MLRRSPSFSSFHSGNSLARVRQSNKTDQSLCPHKTQTASHTQNFTLRTGPEHDSQSQPSTHLSSCTDHTVHHPGHSYSSFCSKANIYRAQEAVPALHGRPPNRLRDPHSPDPISKKNSRRSTPNSQGSMSEAGEKAVCWKSNQEPGPVFGGSEGLQLLGMASQETEVLTEYSLFIFQWGNPFLLASG